MIELAQVLEQMIGVLADSGDTFWSGAIGNDLALLRKGDAYGAERFLTYFGGMYFTADGRRAIVVAEAHRALDFREPHTMRLRHTLSIPQCAGIDHMAAELRWCRAEVIGA